MFLDHRELFILLIFFFLHFYLLDRVFLLSDSWTELVLAPPPGCTYAHPPYSPRTIPPLLVVHLLPLSTHARRTLYTYARTHRSNI